MDCVFPILLYGEDVVASRAMTMEPATYAYVSGNDSTINLNGYHVF